MTEWQPIETAPKDGECFLSAMWLEDEERWFYQLIGWDIHAEMCGRKIGWQNSCGQLWEKFTYWKPLPAPPKEDE